jgi:hypothetical protein
MIELLHVLRIFIFRIPRRIFFIPLRQRGDENFTECESYGQECKSYRAKCVELEARPDLFEDARGVGRVLRNFASWCGGMQRREQ